ncbi:MAG: hypothetical protein HZB71_01555 [Betaproteobacteria bacterium]|nr:hypothetical protein [Betaproteobacteria bacterium]
MKLPLFLIAAALALPAHAFPWLASGDNIRGADLMTQPERQAYVAKLQSMQSMEQCQGFMQAHYLDLERRAKEKNVTLPPVKGDPCKVMQTMGRIK